MTAPAAILALALAVHPPLSLVREAERIDLPPAAAGARLEPHPFSREWTLVVPPAAVRPTLLALRGASRLCPELSSGPGRVTMRCHSSYLRLTIVRDGNSDRLAVFKLSVPPWRPEEEGPPLPPFDLAGLGRGTCPGETPELAGECALAAGDLEKARARFDEAVRAGHAPLAHLRLGDLALRDDDPDAAVAHWRTARAEAPWGRIATARLCELDPHCLSAEGLESVYDAAAVEHALRADVILRRLRLAAFDGQLVEAAHQAAAESGPGGACQETLAWCRHLILLALELPPPAGLDALVAYLEMYGRREGPLAVELVRAAAAQAERAGAPVFAANLLAASTGTIPASELDAHLRRVTELYLAGGDRARADEVVRYARSRLSDASMRAAVWTGLRRAVRPTPTLPSAANRASPSPGTDLDLASARAALDAAHLIPSTSRKGAPP